MRERQISRPLGPDGYPELVFPHREAEDAQVRWHGMSRFELKENPGCVDETVRSIAERLQDPEPFQLGLFVGGRGYLMLVDPVWAMVTDNPLKVTIWQPRGAYRVLEVLN